MSFWEILILVFFGLALGFVGLTAALIIVFVAILLIVEGIKGLNRERGMVVFFLILVGVSVVITGFVYESGILVTLGIVCAGILILVVATLILVGIIKSRRN